MLFLLFIIQCLIISNQTQCCLITQISGLRYPCKIFLLPNRTTLARKTHNGSTTLPTKPSKTHSIIQEMVVLNNGISKTRNSDQILKINRKEEVERKIIITNKKMRTKKPEKTKKNCFFKTFSNKFYKLLRR